jgi:glycosyltransferase involved in cell wall biosynthesis
MKIAFIVSSKNIIPPNKTGGVEYSVYYLARELAKRGHDIILYAAPGSKINNVQCRSMAPFPTFIETKYPNLQERITSFYDLSSMADFFNSGEWREFDLIHYNNYIFYEILPFTRWVDIPVIVRINYPHTYIYPHIKNGLIDYPHVHYLPTSHFIKQAMPGLNYTAPLYPTIDTSDFSFSEIRGTYLLFIGRISPQKGAHLAVQAALSAKKKLFIAGEVKESDREYFNRQVKPYIDNENIIYIGEVNFDLKIELYSKALATLFPIQWDEPCGLVALESMACGTPVIAFNRAATSEIIKDEESGFLVKDGDIFAMAEAIQGVEELDRLKVRRWVENNFSIQKQAQKYEEICKKILSK